MNHNPHDPTFLELQESFLFILTDKKVNVVTLPTFLILILQILSRL